jgi:hypothetical protein
MSNKYEHTRQWWTGWKAYTDGLEIPNDWEDVTYHNDELPSFQFRNFRIWLNAPDASERIGGSENWRFAIQRTNDDGEIIYDESKEDNDLLLTNDINEVIELINN